jgi:class II lanthipeptide synthase
MSLTAAEIEKIVSPDENNSSTLLVPRRELRRMLEALGAYEFSARRGTPLATLCAAGADYGWRELERAAGSNLIGQTSARARTSLRRHLRKTLARITRPCLELEWKSFKLATSALGLATSDEALTERMFLRERPGDRLALLFQKFPVLARLWCLTIRQWCDHVVEVLKRWRQDRRAVRNFFFSKQVVDTVTDVRPGLSDPHNRGRSVTLIEFNGGCGVIYKPRSGKSESAWFSLLAWMNRNGFQPKLRLARLLLRKDYYWMEYVAVASCENQAAVRRFYEQMGGLIAAAYLLKAVDCHRENLIAAGECPVLVDIDALWHVSPLTKTQSPTDVLYRTGFFPNSRPASLQSRSSVLGRSTTGKHMARIAGKPVSAAPYTNEIIAGFSRGWNCILGTPGRRAAFLRIVRRVRSQRRRWIYRATEGYGAVLQASIQPEPLRSTAARQAPITHTCQGRAPTRAVAKAEIEALTRLDLPYFVRRTNHAMPADESSVPSELTEAIRSVLEPIKTPDRKGG